MRENISFIGGQSYFKSLVDSFVQYAKALSDETVEELIDDAFFPDAKIAPYRRVQYEQLRRELSLFATYAAFTPDQLLRFKDAVRDTRKSNTTDALLERSNALHEQVSGIMLNLSDSGISTK